jgi:hypothetical protein
LARLWFGVLARLWFGVLARLGFGVLARLEFGVLARLGGGDWASAVYLALRQRICAVPFFLSRVLW